MATMKASKLQLRVLGLANQECDGTYDHAKTILEAMGLPANAAPAGYTARQAGKLSNEELLEALPKFQKPAEEIKTTEEKKAEEKAYWAQKEEEAEKRRKLNIKLRNNGFRWVKLEEAHYEDSEEQSMKIDECEINGWCLFDSNNKPISLEAAKKLIGWEVK